MAVTKLLRIKEGRGSNPASGLKRNLHYICNPEKTDGGRNIGGNAGTGPADALQTMLLNKKMWGKEDQTQGFHYILSFDPSVPVSIETAHKVAREFCEKLLGDRYYYLYAIHNDKDHMHVHITFDSVSRVDGRKYHSPKGDWEKRIQPISDAVCEKYHLPPLIRSYDVRGVNYGEWKHQQEVKNGSNGNQYNWNDIIRDDVDEAIFESDSYQQFLANMTMRGYFVRDRKYLSLRPEGKPKAVRSGRLGKGYMKEEIISRIKNKRLLGSIRMPVKIYGNWQELRNVIYYKHKRATKWKMTPFQRSFYLRWRRTCFIRKRGISYTWKYRQDILQLQQISDCVKYMLDHDIESYADLLKRREVIKGEKAALQVQIAVDSKKVYRRAESGMTQEQESELRAQLKEERTAVKFRSREEKLLLDMERLFFSELHPKDLVREDPVHVIDRYPEKMFVSTLEPIDKQKENLPKAEKLPPAQLGAGEEGKTHE